jgi:hypothetical protein
MENRPPKQHTAAHELPSAADLLQRVQAEHRVRLQGWSISRDADLLWLTNPYALDVGHYHPDVLGCARILERIRGDTQAKEWGHL